jgi:hypothetical protein
VVIEKEAYSKGGFLPQEEGFDLLSSYQDALKNEIPKNFHPGWDSHHSLE